MVRMRRGGFLLGWAVLLQTAISDPPIQDRSVAPRFRFGKGRDAFFDAPAACQEPWSERGDYLTPECRALHRSQPTVCKSLYLELICHTVQGNSLLLRGMQQSDGSDQKPSFSAPGLGYRMQQQSFRQFLKQSCSLLLSVSFYLGFSSSLCLFLGRTYRNSIQRTQILNLCFQCWCLFAVFSSNHSNKIKLPFL